MIGKLTGLIAQVNIEGRYNNMANIIEVLINFEEELNKLQREINDYDKYNEYFNTSPMQNYMERYNAFLTKYKNLKGIPLERLSIYAYEYSSTKKTVNINCINRFNATIDSTLNIIKTLKDIEINKTVTASIPKHQMRKCLKTGVDGCPKKPDLIRNSVFVGMPFNHNHIDSYEFGIKAALEANAMSHFKADDRIENRDIMCKICEEIQKAECLIFNISDLNPNVMLELGLSYGLGKETILVKHKNSNNISDLSNTEYIEYAHAVDLRDKLLKYFK